jgi:hypothetical protein
VHNLVCLSILCFCACLSYIPFIFPLQEKKLADAKPVDTTETDTEPENDESEAKQAKKKRRVEDGDKIKQKKSTTHKKHRKLTTSKEQKLKKHKKSNKNKSSNHASLSPLPDPMGHPVCVAGFTFYSFLFYIACMRPVGGRCLTFLLSKIPLCRRRI